jgi:hypothetical protein
MNLKWYNCIEMKNIPPCFFCEEPAEYTSAGVFVVEEEKGKLDLVSVCKKHFDFSLGVS